MDNTRQVRGVLSGHIKRGGIVIVVVVEQIGRSSGSYYFLSEVGGGDLFKGKCAPIQVREV